MVVLLVLLTVGIIVSVQLLLEHARRAQASVPLAAPAAGRLSGCTFLHDGHTFARLDTTGEAKIGIDAFLLKILGGAERIVLPEEGRSVRQGERIFAVRRNGREVGLVSPIDGTVCAVNGKADLNGDGVRRDPYGNGWLFSVRPRNLSENLRGLRALESASEWLHSEERRFATFLVSFPSRYAEVGATMQDGGAYPPGILSKMDEEQVKAFERRFLV